MFINNLNSLYNGIGEQDEAERMNEGVLKAKKKSGLFSKKN